MDLVIVVDKNPKSNPSDEKREYTIHINEPLRSLGDVYDEIQIDNESVKIVRRIYRFFGALRPLKTPKVEEVEDIDIVFFEGNNYVYLKDNDTYNMRLSYLVNSGVNKQFATKVEMNSAINQKANEVMITVNKKVDSNDFNHAEIILRINDDTSESKINADKIALSANDILNLLAGNAINLGTKNITIVAENFSVDKNGYMKATSGEIGGFTLGKDFFEAKIYSKYDYTEADLTKVSQYIKNEVSLTDEELIKYDVNEDGVVDLVDMLKIRKFILSGITTTTPARFLLTTSSGYDSSFLLEDGYGNKVADLSVLGCEFKNISASSITKGGENVITTSYNDNGYINRFAHMNTYLEAQITHTDGNISAKGINWFDSDRILKKNIKDSTVNALDVINKIQHREYDRRDRDEHSKLGYIAQELQAIDNSLVFGVKQPNGTEILNINQPHLIPYLTKAIQEQQELIEDLKVEIENLKKKVEGDN